MSESKHPRSASDEHLASDEVNIDALVEFARSSTEAFQGALRFAVHAEQTLANTLSALHAAGLTVDEIAYRVGLAREKVEMLREGTYLTHRLL